MPNELKPLNKNKSASFSWKYFFQDLHDVSCVTAYESCKKGHVELTLHLKNGNIVMAQLPEDVFDSFMDALNARDRDGE